MTTAQKRDLVRKALRQSRKVYRGADTSGEKLERYLDRMINRKTLVTREQLESLVPLWNDYFKRMRELETSLANLLSVAAI